MKCEYFLIIGGSNSVLYKLNKEEYSEKVQLLDLKESIALSIRSIGLADLLVNTNSREVMGIVYSRFDLTLAQESEILSLNSPYVRFLKGNINELDRYKECVPLQNVLEIYWGDLSGCTVEFAAIMGDIWLEDSNGRLCAIGLELENCWDAHYRLCPKNYLIDVAK